MTALLMLVAITSLNLLRNKPIHLFGKEGTGKLSEMCLNRVHLLIFRDAEVSGTPGHQGTFCHQGQSSGFCPILMKQNVDMRIYEPN
jgi:hypothetical protein